ncbi:hypothetical protein Cha6605_1675 [Chamaesiphon minutus PCC 6605]|uniref:Uncharacterized protein n=1 Tax=Chamaesiphon minutus (strain ATCC 27169 / PCC 6605) TaxID=1173020 RepID=K9UDV7_CHAP6|nr:hypothetical protein Cha6605_1675 [Chamaesiphon minutus PCC 6605]
MDGMGAGTAKTQVQPEFKPGNNIVVKVNNYDYSSNRNRSTEIILKKTA